MQIGRTLFVVKSLLATLDIPVIPQKLLRRKTMRFKKEGNKILEK